VSEMFPKRAVASVVGIGGTAPCSGGMLFPFLAGKAPRDVQGIGGCHRRLRGALLDLRVDV
jgi:hypothetical protein